MKSCSNSTSNVLKSGMLLVLLLGMASSVHAVEYLYPGVFVEEVPSETKNIPGVTPSGTASSVSQLAPAALGSRQATKVRVNEASYLLILQGALINATAFASSRHNDAQLWAAARGALGSYLLKEWRGGNLAGNRPEVAFFAKCDSTTMTQPDIDAGRMICLAGVATRKPSEFTILKIAQQTPDHARQTFVRKALPTLK